MNNKYGYRLVDILKRGRGRESSHSALVGGSQRKRDQSGSEKAGGWSLHFYSPIARPDSSLTATSSIDATMRSISHRLLLTNIRHRMTFEPERDQSRAITSEA